MHLQAEPRLLESRGEIRILHLEDSAADVELIKESLFDAGMRCNIIAVRSRAAFEASLLNEAWDLILSDFAIPGYDGFSALEYVKQVSPFIPFIFVTGTMGEENAIESLKSGATDYVLKQNLRRLEPAVARALQERGERIRREQAEASLIEKEEQLRFLAYHDALTKLPNRALLLDRLPEMLAAAQRRHERVALLFLDLDRFKIVNDSLGHSTGDEVLQATAVRLRQVARGGDLIARLGGDEFVVVLSAIHETSDAAIAADRINHVMAADMVVDKRLFTATCSIGISIFPENGSDAETLLRNADTALYVAKEKGRNCWAFFTPDMNAKALERLILESALRHALERNELFLEYQPQVNIHTGKLVGAEALVRWKRPELETVSPATFIPLAENNGEIIPIGEWVLRTACSQVQAWKRKGIKVPMIAVNVSTVQLRDPAFLLHVQNALTCTGLSPNELELEVTESQLMEHSELVIPLLKQIRDMGTGLAIDDFGIGYCGLSYVRDFHFSKLKIDQTFVRSILADPRDAALTGAIINMAKALDMRVVAECVETLDQVRLLKQLGCQEVQGYHVSHPLDAEAFMEKLKASSTLPSDTPPLQNDLSSRPSNF